MRMTPPRKPPKHKPWVVIHRNGAGAPRVLERAATKQHALEALQELATRVQGGELAVDHRPQLERDYVCPKCQRRATSTPTPKCCERSMRVADPALKNRWRVA